MKIALMSDLHLNIGTQGVTGFVKHLENSLLEDADVCVLAGDISEGRFAFDYQDLIGTLIRHYPQVILVAGNHEFYDTTRQEMAATMAQVKANLATNNFHYLDKESIIIQGITFHGATGWYPYDAMNSVYAKSMNDHFCIKDLKDWVYVVYEAWKEYLKTNLKEGDVIVQHHLPSWKCVSKRYENSCLNRFFVGDIEDLILERKPATVLFGHTHMPVDIKIGKTRCVANPRAYPRERKFGLDGYQPKIVEI